MMTEKRFVNNGKDILQHGEWYCSAGGEHCADVIATALNELIDKNQKLKKEKEDYMDDAIKFEKECKRLANNLRLTNGDWKYEEIRRKELEKENEELKQQLSDINGQLLMLDNCDNWDYDRMKHTVREIAEIIGYNGTINPKR